MGLGNPRHIATKSQHLWAVPRQIEFWSIGPNSQLLPKICFEGFPNDGDEGDDDDDHGDDDDDGDDYDGLVLVGIR